MNLELHHLYRSISYSFHSGPSRSAKRSILLSALILLSAAPLIAQRAAEETAWRQGHFQIDTRSVVKRSDVILQRPNEQPHEAMPLGNGRLGVVVWAQEGYTAQLNRGDTFPHRLSAGQVVLPGLKILTSAADYAGRLNLWDGEFDERGSGMTAVTYVDESLDVMVIDVTGADPKSPQTAELRLWQPRKPQVFNSNSAGILAETWLDDKEAGGSNQTFGSLAAITADALNVSAEQTGPLSIVVKFLPHSDGTFRILIGAPSWHGGDARAVTANLLKAAMKVPAAEHRESWHGFWRHAGLLKLDSSDHAAEYFENLRMVDLFTAAAESGDRLPGGQAGIGDLFSPIKDQHQWGPSAYWHWNLRMQVSANIGAGAFTLNQPYFRLYRENLASIRDWTKHYMGGRPGACVPETMRFNGRGYENENWAPEPAINCGEDFHPYYNARTISTGAEVALWIWTQYEYTDDFAFLKENYPLMREAARFLLAYATHGPDGKLHTFPSNAHETQWDVHDPVTDIVAMRSLFPAVIKASALLNTDSDLAAELKKQLPLIPALPLAAASSPKVLLSPGTDESDAIITFSYDPGAQIHNTENDGLEPVWPYGFIGDDGPLHELGVRTFLNRPNKNQNDWSYDPVQAARLGLADQFESSLRALTEKYQSYPSGLASFVGPEFYVEQIGEVADALQQALVQDYDGLIRIAPSWPKDWNADGIVALQHRSRADVQIRNGKVITVGLEAGSTHLMRIRNPWPGEAAEVVDARTDSIVLPAASSAILELNAHAGSNYLVMRAEGGKNPLPFAEISATPAGAPKSLGSRTIGLAK